MSANHFIQQVGPSQFYCLFEDCKNYVIKDEGGENVWCQQHWDFIESRGWNIDDIPTKGHMTPAYWRQIIDRTRQSEQERGIVTQTVTATSQDAPRMTLETLDPEDDDLYDQFFLSPQDINLLALDLDNAVLRDQNARLQQDVLEQQAQVQHWKKQSESYKSVVVQFCDIIDPCVGTVGLPENLFECAARLAQYGQFVANELNNTPGFWAEGVWQTTG